MKIFWKKLALYIQFLKDKESALYFVEVSILYNAFMLTHLRLVLKAKKNFFFCQLHVEGGLQKMSLSRCVGDQGFIVLFLVS